MSELGKKIKSLRRSKGLSLMDLSKIMDVSDTALSKIETGKVESIKIDFGKKLCQVLDVSFNELFEIETLGGDEVKEKEEEISRLKKRVAELEDRLSDKQEINTVLKDTVDFLTLHMQSLAFVYDEPEYKNLPKEEKMEVINELVKAEMGDFVFMNDKMNSLRVKRINKKD